MSRLITNGYHLPYNPDNKSRAQGLRRNATRWENKLWFDCLKGLRPQFYRQRSIDHYIVDFYCPALKLVIEVDGKLHFMEVGVGNDSKRDQILNGYGLKVVRFTNEEIKENFDVVKRLIYDLIHSYRRPPFDKGGSEGGINL